MTFGSAIFLFLFLPAILLIYCACPGIRAKNAWLIAVSVLFYAFGGPVYTLLLLFSVACNYLAGRFVTGRKGVLVCAIAVNLGLLCVFKYLGFFARTLNLLPGVSLPVPSVALPLGISFFTFQGMSYVIDVYRGRCVRNTSFFQVMLYIVLFPRLTAGPIVRYEDAVGELNGRSLSLAQLAQGIRRFILGLSKKLLIADICAGIVTQVYALDFAQLDARLAWLGAVSYLLQIYFDFSGYSDMAIGLGLCFGFHFQENFRFPYLADSIRDFWRRWHISLSTWFREYLYIPLGGNRQGAWKTARNKLIVFLCTGLWHGANWTFVVWGLWHGAFLVLEDVLRRRFPTPKHCRPCRVSGVLCGTLRHIYTLFVVLIGFVIFRAGSLTQAAYLVAAMFGAVASSAQANLILAQCLTPLTLAALGCGCIGCLPILPAVQKKLAASGTTAATAMQAVGYGASVALLVIDLLRLSAASYVPFIYFQF